MNLSKLKSLLAADYPPIALNEDGTIEVDKAFMEMLLTFHEVAHELLAVVEAADLYINNYDSGRGYNEWNAAVSLLTEKLNNI